MVTKQTVADLRKELAFVIKNKCVILKEDKPNDYYWGGVFDVLGNNVKVDLNFYYKNGGLKDVDLRVMFPDGTYKIMNKKEIEKCLDYFSGKDTSAECNSFLSNSISNYLFDKKMSSNQVIFVSVENAEIKYGEELADKKFIADTIRKDFKALQYEQSHLGYWWRGDYKVFDRRINIFVQMYTTGKSKNIARRIDFNWVDYLSFSPITREEIIELKRNLVGEMATM